MRTQLLKKMTFAVALFAATSMSAQSSTVGPTTYTFSDGLQGWVKGYGVGVVTHNPAGTMPAGFSGVADDGALVLDRTDGATTATNNNANIRRGNGGDDAFVVFNADVINVIKIRVKNLTEATNVTIAGTSRPVTNPFTAGAGTSFTSIVVANVITAKEASGYQNVYLDVSAITGEVTRLDLLFRANSTLTDPTGAKLYIDQIDFLTAMPPTTYSEFIQNPNFEDPSGVGFYSGSGATRAISIASPKEGNQSMSFTFSADATVSAWNFGPRIGFADGFLNDKKAVVKMWIKSNRTAPAEIMVRLRESDASDVNIGTASTFPTTVVATSGVANVWEELTFTLPAFTTGVRGVNFWFAVNYTDGATATNAVNGNIFYFDQMSVTLDSTLGTAKNTLEGVSVYPNPANDFVNVNSVNGGDISVFSTIGTKVLSAKATSASHQLNVSGLSSGVYLLELVSEGKMSVTKLVIK